MVPHDTEMKTSVLVVVLVALYPLFCEAICTVNDPMPDDCQQAAMKLEADSSHLSTYCTDKCANPLLTGCKNSDVANLTLALCAMQGDHYCYKMYMDTVGGLSEQECSRTCTANCRTVATNIVNVLGCCLVRYTELNVSSDVFTGLKVLSLCNINIEQFCSNSAIFTHIENTTTEVSPTTTAATTQSPTTEEPTTAEESTTEEPSTEEPTTATEESAEEPTSATEELTTEEPAVATEEPTTKQPTSAATEEPIIDNEPNIENRDCIQDQYPQECMDQLHHLIPNSSYSVAANAVSIICSSMCLELTMQQVKCENNTVINVHTLCMLHNDQYCYVKYLKAISMVPDKCFEEETCSKMCANKYKLFSENLGCCLGAFGETEKFGTILASCNIAVDQPCDIKLSSVGSGSAVNGPSLLLTAIVIGAIMLSKLN